MMEVELKLLVTSQGAQALRQHPLLQEYATSKPDELEICDTYFDTPDLNIRRCDAGLRVRKVGNRWVQTMKCGGSVAGGLHSRYEWESQVAGPIPDLVALHKLIDTKTAWSRRLHSAVAADRLLPVFTTQVKRMVWELRLPQGEEVEFVLDQGNLECDGNSVPISEIELELKSGDPTHLFDFALALQQDIPLQIGNLSKADRGYALFAPQPPAAAKATPLKLSKRITIEEVFQAIAINCLAQIQANVAGITQEYDVESLHQMRVGLRRLRSALELFKDVLQLPEDLQQDLDWLVEQLGAARDWDVLAGSILPTVSASAPDQTLLSEIKLAAAVKAQEKHEAVSAAVSSPRYTRLILSFTRWVQGCSWRDSLSSQEQSRLTKRVAKFAHNVLVRDQRSLQKRGRKLHGGRSEKYHRVRIAAKRTRYATEFFQSLYASKTVLPYLEALTTLQDQLGLLNDAAIAEGLLKELRAEAASLERSAGFIQGYLAASVKKNGKTICKLWKKFASIKLPS